MDAWLRDASAAITDEDSRNWFHVSVSVAKRMAKQDFQASFGVLRGAIIFGRLHVDEGRAAVRRWVCGEAGVDAATAFQCSPVTLSQLAKADLQAEVGHVLGAAAHAMLHSGVPSPGTRPGPVLAVDPVGAAADRHAAPQGTADRSEAAVGAGRDLTSSRSSHGSRRSGGNRGHTSSHPPRKSAKVVAKEELSRLFPVGRSSSQPANQSVASNNTSNSRIVLSTTAGADNTAANDRASVGSGRKSRSKPGDKKKERSLSKVRAAPDLATQSKADEAAETARARGCILLVEDNVVSQMMARSMIEMCGYTVEVANDGETSLEMLAADPERYDMILMDCFMPGIDGFEATQIIREREQGLDRHVIICACTAKSTDENRQRCAASGMDDFLSKPITPDALKELLEKWIVPDRDAAEFLGDESQSVINYDLISHKSSSISTMMGTNVDGAALSAASRLSAAD